MFGFVSRVYKVICSQYLRTDMKSISSSSEQIEFTLTEGLHLKQHLLILFAVIKG